MHKYILLGDEAIAQAAIDAGVSAVYAYPGTPSTEITEYIYSSKEAKQKGIKAFWAANEKTALECAIGASYAGKRAMACMKHVGLNVAADPFMNAAITGVNGALVIVVADDPSMHSSQNEQDSRFYGKFSLIPVLEPTNQQEAYDMVFYAFDISEKYGTPVLIRLTTRLAHSRSTVIKTKQLEQNQLKLPQDPRQYVLLPSIARKRYNILLSNQPNFEFESEYSGYNRIINGENSSLGIIACGIAFNYVMEHFKKEGSSPYPILKISQYPIPKLLINQLYQSVERVLVVEEGYPFVEEQILGCIPLTKPVMGRLDGTLPRAGELNPNLVAVTLGLEINKSDREVPSFVVQRPPCFCAGCPHIDSFNALFDAMKDYGQGRIFSDIGCYTLAALPPYEIINSCVDMGASVTMAKGAADVGLIPSVAVIGDSTFTHSGITGLLDAVVDKSPITIIILDNLTTGMTGGQPSHATNRLKNICLGMGVESDHLHIIKPLKKFHEQNVEIIKKELAYNGVSVIIPERECVQTLNRRMREKFKEKQK